MTKTQRNGEGGNGVSGDGQRTNGFAENTDAANAERKPIHVLSYMVGRDAFIQASIWKRLVQLQDGTEFTAHDVSLRKRYKDTHGEWQSCFSFRGSELYAVAHAIHQANAWILEERSTSDCPF